MNKKQFRSQASSGRASSGFGAFASSAFGSTQSSPLSYIQEPPEYSTIADPNVVVALKNLSKKDSTTKAKALEDLHTYVASSDSDIEDGLLEAWVKLYPRLSIDSARRVRQLSHTLNGQICTKCGKRIARHLPKIAGPWLAGTHDSDRAAARAAQDNLSLVFSSAEKIAGLRRTFQGPLLEYCRDAILSESVQTLSDERAVSREDAEATYARVIATSLAVVTTLLSDLPEDEVSKQQSVYEEIVGDQKLCDFATFSDAAVRRSTHRLVQVAVQKLPHVLQDHVKTVSTAYVYKGLPSDQTASAIDYVQTLDLLTAALPSIWTDAYSGKRSAISRLKQCLKRGSSSSTGVYWERLTTLLRAIPEQVWPSSFEEAIELAGAAREGVSRKEERFNASAAWPAYFALINVLSARVSKEEHQKLLAASVMPIFRQYLQPSPDTADWSITAAKAPMLIARATSVDGVPAMLEQEWSGLGDQVIETAKLSQPQQSKDFEKSQMHVAAAGERWADLQRELFQSGDTRAESLTQAFISTNIKIVKEIVALLKARDSKPFGAVAVIEAILRSCRAQLLSNSECRAALQDWLQGDPSTWVVGPSRRHVVRCLYALASEDWFSAAVRKALDAAADIVEDSEQSVQVLHDFFPQNLPEPAVKAAKSNSPLQERVMELAHTGITDGLIGLFLDMLRVGALTEASIESVLSTTLRSLSEPKGTEQQQSTLRLYSSMEDSTLRSMAAGPGGDQLLPLLLRLEQSSDDQLAHKASALSARLSADSTTADTSSRFNVIMQNLERISETSLRIDDLLDLTKRLLPTQVDVKDYAALIPDLDVWRSALESTIRKPRTSLAIVSPLGGVLHLVQDAKRAGQSPVQFDRDGLSQALRIGMYIVGLLTEATATEHLRELGDRQYMLPALLGLTVLVAEDNMSIPGTHALWRPDAAIELAVMEFIVEANTGLSNIGHDMIPDLGADKDITGDEQTSYRSFFSAVNKLREGHEPRSPICYYTAALSAKVNDNLFESRGHSLDQAKACENVLRRCRSDKDTIATTACIVGLHHPLAGTQTLNRYCNELVADLTDLDLSDEKQEQESMEQLILLNAILQSQEDAVTDIAKQRIIFLIKRLVRALSTCTTLAMTAEISKVLAKLLPGIQDMYGEHWAQVLTYIISFWTSAESESDGVGSSDGRMLLIHATLRLYATLRRLEKSEEPNDDLIDVLKDNRSQIYHALVKLLKSAQTVADEEHQPLMITNELLTRQIAQLPYQPLQDVDELYPLLYAPSRAVVEAAFDILHKHIPAAQEQISLDAALDNKAAHLPDELLSLILEAPTLDSLVDASFDRRMPLSLQGYLYSWRLLFDHFDRSSFRVKSDYIEQLKDGSYLPGLLTFTFDFLGHSRGKPVDAGRFDIQDYVSDTEPSPERDVQWLLTHLYYLALTHMPSLVKSYYLDIRSRQTSLAVESWTAKHISPLIIEASLQAVEEWARNSVKDDPEYEKMDVKVGMRSKEINVSYVVDEQTMAIKVVLPAAYPLASAQVVGVSRVAVKEEKWQSWVRNCQGVINFSNGSITDGLSAWRKNVTGALKGQTECAICYSIIDSQKDLPRKRCPTCKNLFHSSCLFKWFKTSNASTCPLCRNAFNFN